MPTIQFIFFTPSYCHLRAFTFGPEFWFGGWGPVKRELPSRWLAIDFVYYYGCFFFFFECKVRHAPRSLLFELWALERGKDLILWPPGASPRWLIVLIWLSGSLVPSRWLRLYDKCRIRGDWPWNPGVLFVPFASRWCMRVGCLCSLSKSFGLIRP